MANKYDDEDGVWRTIGGRRVFIKTGQSLRDAMKESGKFDNLKKKKDEGPERKGLEQAIKEYAENYRKTNKYSDTDIEKLAKEFGMERDEFGKEIAKYLNDNYDERLEFEFGRFGRNQKDIDDLMAEGKIDSPLGRTKEKTYKATDLEQGKPYTIDYGNGIEKTAIYVGKSEDGNNMFYDGEGVDGRFEFSDKYINDKVKISDNKDDDKFMELHNELTKKGDSKGASKATDLRSQLGFDEDPYKAEYSVKVNGKELKPGDKIKDFRGEEHEFVGFTKPGTAFGGMNGKIQVKSGDSVMEYYPSVFNAEVTKGAKGYDSGEVEKAIQSVFTYQNEPTMGTLRDEPLKPYYDKYGKDAVDKAWENLGNKYEVIEGASIDSEGLRYNELLEKGKYSDEAISNYRKQIDNAWKNYYGEASPYNESVRKAREELEKSPKPTKNTTNNESSSEAIKKLAKGAYSENEADRKAYVETKNDLQDLRRYAWDNGNVEEFNKYDKAYTELENELEKQNPNKDKDVAPNKKFTKEEENYMNNSLKMTWDEQRALERKFGEEKTRELQAERSRRSKVQAEKERKEKTDYINNFRNSKEIQPLYDKIRETTGIDGVEFMSTASKSYNGDPYLEINSNNLKDNIGPFNGAFRKVQAQTFNSWVKKDDKGNWNVSGTIDLRYENYGGGTNGVSLLRYSYDNGKWDFQTEKERDELYRSNTSDYETGRYNEKKSKIDNLLGGSSNDLSRQVERGIKGNQSDLVGKTKEEQKAINAEYLKQTGIANETSNDWVRNAFNEYKKKHPNTKKTISDFIKK